MLLLNTGCDRRGEDPVVPIIEPASSYDAAVATAWFKELNELTKATPGFSPPVAARALGYAGLSLYESVVPGMPAYRSLSGQLNGSYVAVQPLAGKRHHWPACANSALAEVARQLYSNAPGANLAKVNALEARFIASFASSVEPQVLARSVEFGKRTAQAVLIYCKRNGGDGGQFTNFPESYQAPAGPGFWEPTGPQFSRPLQPYWGLVQPFLSRNVIGNKVGPPPAFSVDPGSAFYKEALEVYEQSKTLTPEQRRIAFFWSDDPVKTATPPGHSIAILTQVLQGRKADLGTAAVGYAKVGMALHDAFISCWYTKYRYNLQRPVTYIQQNMNPSWQPVLDTPPFPEFTSGHSVQSAAAAEVMTALFGDQYSFSDSTHVKRNDIDGSPRRFGSFWQAAEEAAVSRLYGGIHYRAAIETGLTQGKFIGQNIEQLRFKK